MRIACIFVISNAEIQALVCTVIKNGRKNDRKIIIGLLCIPMTNSNVALASDKNTYEKYEYLDDVSNKN